MAPPPNDNNLNYGWLVRAKFEEDKARKEVDKKHPPWSKEVWQAAAAAYRAGTVEPERRFPIIITSTTGPFTTREEVQEVAGAPLIPEAEWTTRTEFGNSGEDDGNIMDDGCEPEKVQYCHVNWNQLLRIEEYSDGEEVLVWFQGKRRFAWLAHSAKLQTQSSFHEIGSGKS